MGSDGLRWAAKLLKSQLSCLFRLGWRSFTNWLLPFLGLASTKLLRLLHASVLDQRADIYRRFCQEGLLSQAIQATGALYANLAKPLFTRSYAKWLIPRLGT
jgi:hypothetical protein